jgi:phage pi2 protein 07
MNLKNLKNKAYLVCMVEVLERHNLFEEVDNEFDKNVVTKEIFFDLLKNKGSIYLPFSTGDQWTFNGKEFTNPNNSFTLSIDSALRDLDRAKLI